MYSFLRQFDFTRAYVCLRSHSALLARAESQEVRFSSSSTGQQSSRQCNLNQVHTPGKLNVLQPQYTWLLALLLPMTRHSIHSFHPYFTEKRNQNILSVDLVLSVANRAWSPLQVHSLSHDVGFKCCTLLGTLQSYLSSTDGWNVFTHWWRSQYVPDQKQKMPPHLQSTDIEYQSGSTGMRLVVSF